MNNWSNTKTYFWLSQVMYHALPRTLNDQKEHAYCIMEAASYLFSNLKPVKWNIRKGYDVKYMI